MDPLNFLLLFGIFESTFAGVLNCEANLVTMKTSRWPQEIVQISENVYRVSKQLPQCLAEMNLSKSEFKLYLETGLQCIYNTWFSVVIPYLKW